MIQRRQTLFLILLTFLGIALMFIPSLKVSKPSEELFAVFLVPIEHISLSSSLGHTAAILINFVALILSCLTIFIYKKREVQAKLCYVLMILWLSLTLMIEFCPFVVLPDSSFMVESTHFGTLIGILGMFAAYLSLHYIKKDIELLKSADRIR